MQPRHARLKALARSLGKALTLCAMPRFSLIAVVSADGLIARRADEMPLAWTSLEEQAAFRRAMTGIDWSFLGRRTHELAPNAERRRVVFTRRVDRPVLQRPGLVLFNPARATLDEALALARPSGLCGILGATAIYDYFLDQARVDEAEISIEPANLGKGLPFLSSGDWQAAFARSGLTPVSETRLNDGGTLLRRYVRSVSPAR